MFKMPEKIEFALPEQIGEPDLFVGRKKEFDYFLGDWYRLVEKNFAQNQAIISRRKKGKTAFLQRLFNILWSAGMEREKGEQEVIPFYFSVPDENISQGDFARRFFTQFMLYLFNQGKEKTRAEIIRDLKLPYTDQEAEEKLNALIAGDLISQGLSAYDYTITRDKTYELVFRRIYQKEIDHFVPDIKGEIRKVLGKNNYQKGKFTEFLLKEKLKKPFHLNEITKNGKALKIIPIEMEERKMIHTGIGKSEIDLYIKGKNGYELYIDIKNTKNRYGKKETDRWLKIAEYLRKDKTKTLFLVYSENGYTKETQERLEANGIHVIKDSEIKFRQ